MKKAKIIVPAIALLALGVAGSTLGTVAWYAADANAKVNVNTAGRPSGIAATASETAVINVSTIGIPLSNSKMKMPIQTAIAIIDNVLPRFPTLVFNGVSSSSSASVMPKLSGQGSLVGFGLSQS